MGRKKNYNPFKMWEAWIGLMAGSITEYFILIYEKNTRDLTCQVLAQNGGACAQSSIIFFIPLSIIFGIVGFIIGWSIQLIWRNIKK